MCDPLLLFLFRFFFAKPTTDVSKGELEMLVCAFFYSRFIIVIALFSCLSKTSVNHLQAVQNATARFLTHTHKFTLTLTFTALRGEARLISLSYFTLILQTRSLDPILVVFWKQSGNMLSKPYRQNCGTVSLPLYAPLTLRLLLKNSWKHNTL